MVSCVTQGVKVSVETFFQPDKADHYAFAYRVTIENEGEDAIQLLNRHWKIFDSVHFYREVSGEGVVGQQPVLKPGDRYQYVSGCFLKSDFGKMNGSYEMINLKNGVKFPARIPDFLLVPTYKLN